MRAELPATSERNVREVAAGITAGKVEQGANVRGDAERLSDLAQGATFHLHSRAAELPEQVAGPSPSRATSPPTSCCDDCLHPCRWRDDDHSADPVFGARVGRKISSTSRLS